MKVALLQYGATPDKAANGAKAMAMAKEALEKGAQFVLLPEIFNFRGDTRDRATVVRASEGIPGPSVRPFMGLAQRYKAHILLGSLFERGTGKKVYNTSVLIGADGQIVAKYRKINLFEARLADRTVREADCFGAGTRKVMATVAAFKTGLSVCYDLRFPEVFRHYAKSGADVLTVPSCFTKMTGKAHWEILLRARAIENLAYVLAPNQVGTDARGIEAYGHSMIVAPWGEVLSRGSGEREEIVYGDIRRQAISEARKILPGIIGRV